MGSAQSYRAGLSISEKFESPDVFNHCIVRLHKNDVIVRLKFAKFQQCKNQLEVSAREILTLFVTIQQVPIINFQPTSP